MLTFTGTTTFQLPFSSAVTLGKFDGIHRGHQKLMARIREKYPGHAVVFAFQAKQEGLLLTKEEETALLEQLGMDVFIDCPFVPEISGMSPDDFIDRVLVGQLHAAYVAVGTDFRFGYHRAGDARYLQQAGEARGIEVDILNKECHEGREISSTYAREALTAGNMELVEALLGRAYSITGEVIRGHQLGSKLGMPTANVRPDPTKLLPPDGVYVSFSSLNIQDGLLHDELLQAKGSLEVSVREKNTLHENTLRSRRMVQNTSKLLPGVTNLGYKPTVSETFRGLETHLFAPQEALYGRTITTQLKKYLRPEQRFETLDALQEQIKRDIFLGREYFGE